MGIPNKNGVQVDNIIQYIRRKKKIKQNSLARELNVSPSYLCKIERGAQKPTEKFIASCAKFLNVSINELFPDRVERDRLVNINNSFKNQLWSVRKEKRIKQKALADLLECSPSYLSKVEKGLHFPSDKFKKKCAKILKVKETELFP